jgi:hypothetical protein
MAGVASAADEIRVFPPARFAPFTIAMEREISGSVGPPRYADSNKNAPR